MEIVAGLGCTNDLQEIVEAGVDEVFVGYVPEVYLLKHGMEKPLNRREVRFYNVQIGSESELRILLALGKEKGIKITLALNALFYEKEQINDVLELMNHCFALGVHDFILADDGLIRCISERKDSMDERYRIHVSGEYGELNHVVVSLLARQGVARVIFPRQTTLTEMEQIISRTEEKLEYEAFVLNEKCHFTGAYCNSLHCDELCHMCKVPYRLASDEDPDLVSDNRSDDSKEYAWEEDYLLGETGCGLCNLYRMKEIGITHLKVVSRGNSGEATAMDVAGLKQALFILDDSKSEEEYRQRMMAKLFPHGCSHNCYGGIYKRERCWQFHRN